VQKLTFYFSASLLFFWLIGVWLKPVAVEKVALLRIEKNYEKSVDKICKELDLPSSYFKALIVLECSGQSPAGKRFEEHVYHKLKQLQKGKIDTYSGLKSKDLKRYSDHEIRLLATSWGPLQIMGYHCIPLGKSIEYFAGKNALYNSIAWCKRTYGHLLNSGSYRDAFHFHNTGKVHPPLLPKTTDPNYVRRGMAYMETFAPKHDFERPYLPKTTSIGSLGS
jgi:hypothetical protein